MIYVFKNKNFSLLAIGSFISTLGDFMYNIALTIGIYNLTGDIASIALMWLIRGVLRIPVQFFAGVIADKYNRKKIIVLMNLISAPIACMFVLIDMENFHFMYLIIFLLQTLNDIEVNSAMSILPVITPKEDLSCANTLFTTLGTIAMFISPTIAGILYHRANIDTIYLINGSTFLISGILFSFITFNHEKVETVHKFNLLNFAFEGYKQLLSRKECLTAILLFIPFAFLGRFYEIYKVYIADVTLNIGSEGIIYFSYAMAIGGLTSPILIKLAKKKLNYNNLLLYMLSLTLTAALYLIWASMTNLYLSLMILAILASVSSTNMIFLTSLLQSTIDERYLGRVFSLNKVVIIFSAIAGISLAPISKQLLGVQYSIGWVSLIGLVTSLVMIYLVVSKGLEIEVLADSN